MLLREERSALKTVQSYISTLRKNLMDRNKLKSPIRFFKKNFATVLLPNDNENDKKEHLQVHLKPERLLYLAVVQNDIHVLYFILFHFVLFDVLPTALPTTFQYEYNEQYETYRTYVLSLLVSTTNSQIPCDFIAGICEAALYHDRESNGILFDRFTRAFHESKIMVNDELLNGIQENDQRSFVRNQLSPLFAAAVYANRPDDVQWFVKNDAISWIPRFSLLDRHMENRDAGEYINELEQVAKEIELKMVRRGDDITNNFLSNPVYLAAYLCHERILAILTKKMRFGYNYGDQWGGWRFDSFYLLFLVTYNDNGKKNEKKMKRVAQHIANCVDETYDLSLDYIKKHWHERFTTALPKIIREL